jgi:ketosteroid isomerase-like protein
MNRAMTRLLIMALCAGTTLVLAQTKGADTKKPAASNAAADELKKIENDWVDAQKTKNTEKLEEILADSWVGLDSNGKTMDKAKAIALLKSPSYSMDNVEMGPMKVRFFGNTAIVTGSDTEKSKEDGKDTSGKYVWTDVYVKQDGKWKAVASQSTKLSK